MESNEALWAIIGVVVGAILTGIINFLLQMSQFRHNKEMYYIQNQSKEQVKELILELLNHRSYTDRTFGAIRKQVGGYKDDEIRLMLHEIGAKKSSRKDNGGEWWYLKEREEERIAKRKNR